MISPLVSLQTASRRPFSEVKVGDLVTVELFGGKISGAKISRIHEPSGTYFVTLAGLTVPEPYSIGMELPLSSEKVIDW